MNEKITFPSLVNLLALKSGAQRKTCEEFLKEFFNVIVETLAGGENVRIKGLGIFKVIAVEPRKSVNVNTGEQFEIPGHRKIVFVPAKELAEDINAPFAMFESVELPDNFTDIDELEKVDEPVVEANAQEEQKVDTPDDSPLLYEEEMEAAALGQIDAENQADASPDETETANMQTETIPEDEAGTDDEADFALKQTKVEAEAEADTEVETNTEGETEAAYNYDDSIESYDRGKRKKNFRFLLGFIAGVAFTALLSLAFYIFVLQKWQWNATKELVKEVAAVETRQDSPQTVAPVDSAMLTDDSLSGQESGEETQTAISKKDISGVDKSEDLAPTQPSDKKTYDTISKTRYLTTMAKEHYGNYNLWPYIYEENKSFLGHPDRIRPGTRVVIPDLSKYGVDPSNPEHIKMAKKKGVEIYSRFKN